ncbi:hypothetical protein KP509_36G045600 [Ceratopteris richardii]|uniref:GOLD domain-containing protein n=1 Tax=Ceratopteris richardii TaxID=49495 RepID=A0A8T2QBA8_CERRI|nr:hypothetical protein KP509_36G045600 [Ceratopteris richardii]
MEGMDTKCLLEDLWEKSLILIQYHTLKSESPKNIFVRVSSPIGKPLHHQEQVSEGEFSFTTQEKGTYVACFWIPHGHKDRKASVDLEWRTGVADKDWSAIARREKIDGMKLFAHSLHSVYLIMHEMLWHKH